VVKAANVCNVVPNPSLLSIGPVAQSPHVGITSGVGCAWTAESGAPWISVSTGAAAPAASANGSGDAPLIVTIAANPAALERKGTLTVGGQTVQVTQAGVACTFSLAPVALTAPAAGISSNVALATPAECAWSVQSGAPWLSAAPTSGTGSATLTVTVQGNSETAARNAALTIGNQLLPVAQSGIVVAAAPATPPPDPCATLRLLRSGDQISSVGLTGPLSFDVVADPSCTWQARSTEGFITVIEGGVGRGNGVVRYLVELNPFLATRTGKILVGATSFAINQTATPVEGNNGDGGGDGGGGSGGSGGSSGGGSG
jgi:hypothetical protein